MDDWKSNPQICIAWIKCGDDLRAAFVIDGRNYESKQTFKQDVVAAFDWANSNRLVAEFETSSVGLEETAPHLPSWEEYRETYEPGMR